MARKRKKKVHTPKQIAKFWYRVMENALNQIEQIAVEQEWKDLEQACIMFETDLREVEFAVDEVK